MTYFCAKLIKDRWAFVDLRLQDLLLTNSWCLTNGYLSRRVTIKKNQSEIQYFHRLIIDCPKELEVDHINGNKLDNRLDNLRVCNHATNMANWDNCRGRSRYRGVTWSKERKKWVAQIHINGKNRRIGRFNSELEAARAYDKEARLAWGLYAHLNFKETNHG